MGSETHLAEIAALEAHIASLHAAQAFADAELSALPLHEFVRRQEIAHIMRVLRAAPSVEVAAKRLGVSVATIYRRLPSAGTLLGRG